MSAPSAGAAPTGWSRFTAGAGVFVAIFVAGAFATGLTAIADGDIFWHLAAGRRMVATHAFLRSDPFSSGAFGRPWIDVHWLFQLAAYGLERLGGLRALVLAKAALVVGGALVLAWVVDRGSASEETATTGPLYFVAMLAALFAARHLLLVRPVVLTLVFLALAFAALERHRRVGDRRALFWLPILEVVWVNCQGLSALGLGLVAAYLVAALAGRTLGNRRFYPFAAERPGNGPPLLGTLGACLAASFVSPYGLRAALLPLSLLLRITPAGANVFAREVAENIPPFVLARTAPAEIAHLPWFLLALAGVFLVSRRRLPLAHALVLAGLLALALMANRNILLLYWLGTPIAVMHLGAPVAALARRRRHPAVLPAIGGTILLLLTGLSIAAAGREPPLSAPTPFHFPTESARQLDARPGVGTLFAPDHQGGYLIWALGPRFRPYLDTRLILRTADEYAEVLGLLDHPDRFDAFQRVHRFDYVVLPTSYPDRYLGLLQHLAGSVDWTLLFTDGSETLFGFHVPDEPIDLGSRAQTERLLFDLRVRYGARAALLEAARLHLAKLQLAVGQVTESEFSLAGLTSPAARGLRARGRLLAGDRAGAEAEARALLREDPRNVGSLTLLARVALAGGATAEGLTWLRRALDVDPFDDEARALLRGLEEAAAPTR